MRRLSQGGVLVWAIGIASLGPGCHPSTRLSPAVSAEPSHDPGTASSGPSRPGLETTWTSRGLEYEDLAATDAMFDVQDGDGDGFLSRAEFRRYASAALLRPSDFDGDGRISRREFRASFVTLPNRHVGGVDGLPVRQTDEGHQLISQGRTAEALEMALAAVRDRPGDVDALLLLARAYLELRRYGEAIERYRGVVDLDPGNLEAHFQLAIVEDLVGHRDRSEAELALALDSLAVAASFQSDAVGTTAEVSMGREQVRAVLNHLLDTRQLSRARRLADRVCEVSGWDSGIVANLYAARAMEEGADSVLPELDRDLEAHGDDFFLLSCKGTILASRGEFAAAAKILKLALRAPIGPEAKLPARVQLIGCLISLGQVEAAGPVIASIAAGKPSTGAVEGLLCQLYEAGQSARAEALCRALNLEAASLPLPVQIAAALAQGKLDAALNVLERPGVESGHFARAAPRLLSDSSPPAVKARFLELFESRYPDAPMIWQLHLGLLMSADRLPEGLELVERVLERTPDDREALATRAELQLQLDQLDRAEASLARAEEAGVPEARLQTTRVRLLIRRDEDPEAVARFVRTRGKELSSEARRNIGVLLAETERWQEAIDLLREDASEAPSHSPVRFVLGLALERTGQTTAAAAYQQHFESWVPQDPYMLQVMARLYEGARQFSKAVRILEAAQRRAPDDVNGWIRLAEAQRQAGDGAGFRRSLDLARRHCAEGSPMLTLIEERLARSASPAASLSESRTPPQSVRPER